MSLYAVQAQVSTERDGYVSTRQVPTFFLDPNVQGIVSEKHAKVVAREILESLGVVVDTVCLSVVKV